jgi:hypothetical protein
MNMQADAWRIVLGGDRRITDGTAARKAGGCRLNGGGNAMYGQDFLMKWIGAGQIRK